MNIFEMTYVVARPNVVKRIDNHKMVLYFEKPNEAFVFARVCRTNGEGITNIKRSGTAVYVTLSEE